MSERAFEVPSGLPDIVALGIQLWGDPTNRKPNEVLFGKHESKIVNPAPVNTWFDHEANVGGGYCALYKLKYGTMPERPGFPIPPGMAGELGEPVTWWDYHSETGAIVARVVRFQPRGKDKTYRQCRPDGDRWRWKMEGLKIPLYHLPELLGAETGATVYITEGEKHADQLRSWGLIATTNAGGAKKFRADHAATLARFDCVILPDNDDAGREHRDVVVASLRKAGCHSIRVLNLPDLPPKGDVIDWVKAGGTADAFLQFAAEARPSEPAAQAAPAEPRSTVDGWQRLLLCNDRGDALPVLANAAASLRGAPELAGIVTYDEMLRHALVTRSLPGSWMAAVFEARPMMDADVAAIQEWMQHHGLAKIGREVTHQAVDLVAREAAFHPVRQYLTSLRWDGVKRLDTWLSTYLGSKAEHSDDFERAIENVVTHQKYTRAIGRMFLIAMVARIMRPGCKADYMIILEGEQGARKSTVCAILGGKWFSDSLPDVTGGKDVAVHLNGKWLIEVAELSAMSKAESDALKSFVTRDTERYRPPYGREEVIAPRQCVFIGTTNQAAYLKDETGGRRFWPVRVGNINTEDLERDRDQLFAEAMVAFQAREKWWPDGDFERKYIAPQQESRFVIDEWEGPLAEWLTPTQKDQYGVILDKRVRCTVPAAAYGALSLDTARLGRREQLRITSIFKRLGRGPGRDKAGRWWERLPAPAGDMT